MAKTRNAKATAAKVVLRRHYLLLMTPLYQATKTLTTGEIDLAQEKSKTYNVNATATNL